MNKLLEISLLVLGITWLLPNGVLAQAEPVCDRDVIVQVDDWLSKLSEKFYGDVLAFPAIFEATNTKALQDESYAQIDDPDLIEPGWKLCIVDVATAEEILGFTLDQAPPADDTPVNLRGPIKVGAAYALSGSLAASGQSIRRGVELAVQEINESGFLGEGTLQTIWEDTAGDEEQAVQAFDKLIQEDEVVAILGPTLSRSAFAADPLAQTAGVPVIGSSNTAPGITDIGSYIFSTSLPEDRIIAEIIQSTKTPLNLENVVIVYDETNPFTQASYEAFKQVLAQENIGLRETFSISRGDSDFSPQLAEIQTLEADAIILNLLPEEAVQFILQAQQQGISGIPFIGGSSLNTPRIFELDQDLPDGVISGAAWNLSNPSGSARKFITDYEAAYGASPDQFAAQAYTAIWALATALRRADSSDRTTLRDTLDALELIESPLGLFTFDENRNPDYSPIIQITRGRTFVIFKE